MRCDIMTKYIDFIEELNREIANLEQKIVDEENALLVKEFPVCKEFRCEYTDKNGKIISEYFDTEDDRFLEESINGTDNRRKYRIRFYDLNEDFFRIERKERQPHIL